MSITVDTSPARQGFVGRIIGSLRSLMIGSLLCLTAPTSLIALGWLMRRMRFVAATRAGLAAPRPGWLMATREGSLLVRLLGGLAANIREGVLAAISLALATAPFAIIWVLSWWAGWENSFSKGYEQAFVGPSLGLTGVVVFCIIMIWLPLALVHQAVENRALALFEWRKIKSAVRHTGWGYVCLAVTTVFFALPLFAGRGLITFASGIVPGFDDMTTDQIAGLSGAIDLSLAIYVFVSLVILRGWAARIYARAVASALDGPDAALWQDSPLAGGHIGGSRSWRLTHWMRGVLLVIIWFGLATQIFVAQFLNHDWHVWLTHPYFLLPWAP